MTVHRGGPFVYGGYSVSGRIRWILLNTDGIGQIIAPIFFDV